MLYVLKNADTKLRKAILKNASPEIIKTLCEISYNTLIGNHKICHKTKRRLFSYKRELRKLSCPKRSVSSKRKILIQKGGFLPALIGSLLSGVIASYLNK